MKKKRIKHTLYTPIVVFDPAEEGGFNVSFPAFPGCVTFGRTLEEAKTNAKEVFSLWQTELNCTN